ncbi:MAG TPA: lactate utilization protein C [Candidatus Dormibacteraeota bacterium]|jgi:L-lactate dehydrogenase complex protein LldG|nr:lactate utilization protein C [Candidatus Dormibacteraeota bacterium]
MSARENILARIREANGGKERANDPGTILARLDARVRGPLPTMEWETQTRFRERCIAMMSTIGEAESIVEVPRAVASYLKEKNLPTSGACWPEFAALDWAGAGLAVEARPSRGDDKLGITGAFCALAENGTLMLLSGEDTYATTSLLPENHVAVVPASRIVRTMEDAWDLLRRERGSLPRQVNFVSGPSRTADIEMTLVLGAHGPFRVHVIVVGV